MSLADEPVELISYSLYLGILQYCYLPLIIIIINDFGVGTKNLLKLDLNQPCQRSDYRASALPTEPYIGSLPILLISLFRGASQKPYNH